MKIRQAIVTSIDPSDHQLNDEESFGNACKVIAMSSGIDQTIAASLCHWCPGRGELAPSQNQSVNFFHLDDETVAISRSTFAELEKRELKQKNGSSVRIPVRNVVSMIAILNTSQLSGYQNNPALLAQSLCSMGYLALPSELLKLRYEKNELPMLEIASESFLEPESFCWGDAPNGLPQDENISRAIEIHKKVLIRGVQNRTRFLSSYLATLPNSDRMKSFSTGISFSPSRPFAIQFQPAVDQEIEVRTILLKATPTHPTDHSSVVLATNK